MDEQMHLISQGRGISGANPDYVIETVKAMEAIGYREGELHRLAERLRQAR
jgi:cation transport protein ChaC